MRMAQYYALTARGLGNALEKELRSLGFKDTEAFQGGVLFETDLPGCYTANLKLRTASRVLQPLLRFKAMTNEVLYKNIMSHDWTQYILPSQTLAVEASVRNSEFKDQRFVALKVKDAIVDQFREKFEIRPDVDSKHPDLKVWVRVVENEVLVAIDTSGDPLFKRRYRVEDVPAPIKEHVAAALLQMTDWDMNSPLIDPMCGSGTFLIEAAMMAMNAAPGLQKKSFGFQKLLNYDPGKWNQIVEATLGEEKTELPFKFYGYDISRTAVNAAKKNIETAGLTDFIDIARSGVSIMEPPCEKGMIIVNPPYGERIGTDEGLLKDSYLDLGFALKSRFGGWTAWVLSPKRELTNLLGFKPTKRFHVWNGPIECEFIKYEIFKNP